MTEKEARTVCNIMMYADGECPYCAHALLKSFVKIFPDFAITVGQVWREWGYDFDPDDPFVVD